MGSEQPQRPLDGRNRVRLPPVTESVPINDGNLKTTYQLVFWVIKHSTYRHHVRPPLKLRLTNRTHSKIVRPGSEKSYRQGPTQSGTQRGLTSKRRFQMWEVTACTGRTLGLAGHRDVESVPVCLTATAVVSRQVVSSASAFTEYRTGRTYSAGSSLCGRVGQGGESTTSGSGAGNWVANDQIRPSGSDTVYSRWP